MSQGVFSDTITYQQMRQDYGGRSPAQILPLRQRQGQDPVSIVSQIPTQGAPPANGEENSGPAEFVRLRTGRIVDFSPGLLCDENCIEPVSSKAFGETGVNLWWIVTPAVAGGVLCSVLCRSDRDDRRTSQKIIIPVAEPHKHPTPVPPQEIPEPGTLLLLGLGLGVMIARKRHHRSNISEV